MYRAHPITLHPLHNAHTFVCNVRQTKEDLCSPDSFLFAVICCKTKGIAEGSFSVVPRVLVRRPAWLVS